MEYQNIKVSTNWDCIKSFQWMVEHARFIFSNRDYKGERLYLVLKEGIEQYDCFEIGYDQYGLTTDGTTIFNLTWGNTIQDSSKEIIPFIKDYLKREGASDLLTEKAFA